MNLCTIKKLSFLFVGLNVFFSFLIFDVVVLTGETVKANFLPLPIGHSVGFCVPGSELLLPSEC